MKPKRRILSLLLAICLVVGIMPTAAFAANNDKAIQLGASNISGYDSTNGYDYIYYGEWDNSPIKWRVLDERTNTQNEGLFLLSDVLLGTGTYGGVYFDNSGSDSNVWQKSTAQTWCKNFYSNNFSSKEQNAVLATTKSDSAYTSTSFGYAYGVSSLSGDKVFFLSAEEAENSAYGFTDDNARIANYGNSAGYWWLRSPYAFTSHTAGLVHSRGGVYNAIVGRDRAARPAFNLDLNSVLFISAAEGGKISAAASGGNQGAVGADAIFEIGNNTGSEWKLTLLDSSRNFSISDAAINSSGDTMAFSYSNAQTGTNEYISVVIEDNGAITHYGRILQLDGTTGSASGTASLTLPAGVTLDNDTKLYVFNEQYNGGEKDDTKRTDYGSKLIKVNPTVDNTAPALSDGTATRDSETAATVKFISDEAGTCYYIAQDTEITLTNAEIAAQGTKQACSAGENEIKLDNISASAQYVAIVAQDAVGNVSQPLKISIPAYIAPSYGISASPAALNFGSKTVDYTEAPAAQTVTLTNTGNQNVTVNLPTSTNYIITGGEGFTNDTATLAPNGTASFTAQPKTGLGAGDYSETLTISGSNSTSASVKLSFEVLDTYTLTVNLNGGSGTTTGGEYPAGEAINIDAGSRSNYRFNGWTSSNGGSFADASSASTTFTMPAADTTITANWEYNGGGSTGGSTTDYYRLTFDTNGGSEIASIRRAEHTTIDLSGYTPTREGYEFTGWYADKDLTDKITSIRLTRNTTVYAGWEEKKENPGTGFENPFTDISKNDWFYDDVMFVFTNGLMVGTGDATFSPEISTSRAMIAVTLWRMEGEPAAKGANPYTDVENGAWYTEAITWANENGIAEGYGNGCFQPETPVTREQLAAFFYRYAAYKGYDITITGSIDHFNDKDNVSEWAKDTMAWAVGYGLIGGKDNNMLDPQGEATRAEFAAMLQRFCQKG